MIGNYWNSAYRNLMKRKGFSFINVFGLAVGTVGIGIAPKRKTIIASYNTGLT